MKTEVTEQGITKHLFLEGVTEVEIRREKNYILVIPLSSGSEDPILRFGKNPVSDNVTDASVNHDEYIYGN